CVRAYTESVTAGMLLGVGTVVMVSGIVWLSVGYLRGNGKFSEDESEQEITQYMSISESIARLTVYGTASLVSALLGITVADYVKLISTPPGLYWTILVFPFSCTIIMIAVSCYMHRWRNGSEFVNRMASGSIFRALVLTSIFLALVGTA